MAGLAAYSNEHINSTARDIATYLAMQGPSPTAELEHLPQHGDPPLGRCIPKHVDHGARRIGIGVVTIVKNYGSVVDETFAAHCAGARCLDNLRQFARRNTEDARR